MGTGFGLFLMLKWRHPFESSLCIRSAHEYVSLVLCQYSLAVSFLSLFKCHTFLSHDYLIYIIYDWLSSHFFTGYQWILWSHRPPRAPWSACKSHWFRRSISFYTEDRMTYYVPSHTGSSRSQRVQGFKCEYYQYFQMHFLTVCRIYLRWRVSMHSAPRGLLVQKETLVHLVLLVLLWVSKTTTVSDITTKFKLSHCRTSEVSLLVRNL